MPASVADICNVALARVGHREFIDSLIEQTEAARVCDRLWTHALDTVLAAFPWHFAIKRVTLAEVAATTVSGWGYVYALPADYVGHPRLHNEANIGPLETAEGRSPFSVEGAGGFARLLSDVQGAELVYTSRITDPAQFPPLFSDALAWLLASDLAFALSVKPQLGVMARQQYERALSWAQAVEMRQEQRGPTAESEFIRERS